MMMTTVTGVFVFAVVMAPVSRCIVFHAENAGALQMTIGSGIGIALGGNCTDFKRQPVGLGERFVPLGYDACTTCTCEQGRPEMCLSMLCSPPKECANLVPLDDKCCEFECFDTRHSGNGLSPSNVTVADANDVDALNATNLGLRLVASTITSFLILALLLFMIHRLRQRRLLLMIRRINASQVVGMPYGDHRYSVGEDGSVGYLTGNDQVDFPPYDDPPPPYTFWKPPECYFQREEAPPPYDVSQQLNENDRNQLAAPIYHCVQVAYHLPYSTSTPTANYVPPHQQQTQPQSHYANLPVSIHNGIIPSLTQVSLRTNNFQMNDLDQETNDTNRRHSLPIRELNVVGSLTSLNTLSSQSELNVERGTLNETGCIRSDAVYDDTTSGMLSPIAVNVVAVSNAATITTGSAATAASDCRSKWEEEANLCSHPDVKRSTSNVRFCRDPTSWEADVSETSSSSSPTFERTTMSPTSSDSSSIDYTYGRHHHRDHSSPKINCKTSLPCLPAVATKSSSLDRTLGTLRAKISGPGKLRRLLGGRNSSSDLRAREMVNKHINQSTAEPLPAADKEQCPPNGYQRRRRRPRSYDFGDLRFNRPSFSAADAPIVEETSTSTDNPPPPLIAAAAECRCGSHLDVTDSLDSFNCTCSFGSMASTPSREGLAGSLVCSPMSDVENRYRRPPRASLSRSGSVCSETGERRLRQENHSVEGVHNGISQDLEGIPEVSSNFVSTDGQACSSTDRGRVRVALSSFKGSHESYI